MQIYKGVYTINDDNKWLIVKVNMTQNCLFLLNINFEILPYFNFIIDDKNWW